MWLLDDCVFYYEFKLWVCYDVVLLNDWSGCGGYRDCYRGKIEISCLLFVEKWKVYLLVDWES